MSGRSLPLCRCLGSAEALEGSLTQENPVCCVGDPGSGMKELQELFQASATSGK